MTSVPEHYDFLLNNEGYLLAWESEAPYTKIGPNTVVEQQDLDADEISENKLDGLYWSSQRSWFNGGGQKRLDSPNSDPEKFWLSKNIDNTTRGEISLSNAIKAHTSAPVATATQAQGYAHSQPDYFVWAAPNSGASTTIELRTVQAWNDTSPDVRSTGFGASHEVQGLTADGDYVYASNATGGAAAIRRGLITQTTTTLSAWHTRGLRDIAFVKEAIYGWTVAGGSLVIYQVDTAAVPTETAIKTYGPGWTIRTVSSAQDAFAELGTHVAWIANAAGDGYVWLYNGSDPAFIGARFPNIEAIGVVSYANDRLFVLGRQRASVDDTGAYDATEAYDTTDTYDGTGLGGKPLTTLFWIEVKVQADGASTWDILHTFDGVAQPKFEVRGREILFLVQQPVDSLRGLTEDAGISGSSGYSVASFNVATSGLTLGRYWGLTASNVTTAAMYGDTGFSNPCIGLTGNAVGIAGEHGGTRHEDVGAPAPMGEVVSSQIDLNIDSPKVFLVGESAFDDLDSGASVTLQFYGAAIDPVVAPVWTTIGTATSGQSIRELISGTGYSTVHAHYRLQLAIDAETVDSPVAHKAGFGMEPTVRPRFEHVLTVKAYERMKLRNDRPFPGNRTPESIQAALEALRGAQTVVPFREPRPGKEPASAVSVQVRHVETAKRQASLVGGSENLITVKLREIPE